MNKGVLFLVAGILLLGGLFYVFKPKHVAETAAPAATPAPGATVAPAAVVPKRFEISVKGGKVTSPGTMTVTEGDAVVLHVTTDKPDEMHLHGYELELMLDANIPAELRFKADRTGHFDLELHKHHAELGALEVQPKS